MLSKNERKEIIEEVMTHFDEAGINVLSEIGHKEKYTPLYHFRIAEPTGDDFLYVTELFGRDSYAGPGELTRIQYHGNYHGLSQVVLQGVGAMRMDIPRNPTLGHAEPHLRPSFQLYTQVTDDQREEFDRSLIYLRSNVRFLLPSTVRHEAWPEAFSDTYHI